MAAGDDRPPATTSTERLLAYAIAAAAAGWAAYNLVTLTSDGSFWMPGNRYGGIGQWRQAADAPGACALSLGVYALAPLFFVYLARRRASRDGGV